MLGAIGDLVEDVRVALAGPINVASDTAAVVTRHRGGSAANVAVAAAGIEGRARFIGQVGADGVGDRLIAILEDADVEAAVVSEGRSGTIVVLVDDTGERTMLSDRGTSPDLAVADSSWLDGLHSLHVPFYSLATGPVAVSARALIGAATARGIAVSVDASSTAELRRFGVDRFVDLMGMLEPTVLFANDDEAAALAGVTDLASLGTTETVVHGPALATVRRGGDTWAVPTAESDPADSTGAGDAFAAGYMIERASGAGPEESAAAGHAAARRHLTQGMLGDAGRLSAS